MLQGEKLLGLHAPGPRGMAPANVIGLTALAQDERSHMSAMADEVHFWPNSSLPLKILSLYSLSTKTLSPPSSPLSLSLSLSPRLFAPSVVGSRPFSFPKEVSPNVFMSVCGPLSLSLSLYGRNFCRSDWCSRLVRSSWSGDSIGLGLPFSQYSQYWCSINRLI